MNYNFTINTHSITASLRFVPGSIKSLFCIKLSSTAAREFFKNVEGIDLQSRHEYKRHYLDIMKDETDNLCSTEGCKFSLSINLSTTLSIRFLFYFFLSNRVKAPKDSIYNYVKQRKAANCLCFA